MINFFAPRSVAERYARGRPYFHPQVIQRIKATLRLKEPVTQAVDVGCGTGLSTLALMEIARAVVGIDISAEMIAQAPQHPHISYLVAPAEKLPLADQSTDLLTVSSALHWINGQAFLAEAYRIIRPRGWLLVYDNAFTGKMQENHEFQNWVSNTFLKRYPTPSRANPSFTARAAKKAGFRLPKEETYQNIISFTLDSLIAYFVTQSNIIAAVEGGNEALDDTQNWLRAELTPFFKEQATNTFLFHGSIWYLKKAK